VTMHYRVTDETREAFYKDRHECARAFHRDG
jgi:hypothetical protein